MNASLTNVQNIAECVFFREVTGYKYANQECFFILQTVKISQIF